MLTRLTFTRARAAEGLRHWDLRGPAGLVRFETVDAIGIRSSSVWLHAAVAPGDAELEDCELCGRCWRDAMGGDHARGLREDWEGAAYHDAVIRTALERWYAENLAAWVEDKSAPADVQAVPVKALPMLLAEHAPDLPYVALATLAHALDRAGYRIVRAVPVSDVAESDAGSEVPA